MNIPFILIRQSYQHFSTNRRLLRCVYFQTRAMSSRDTVHQRVKGRKRFYDNVNVRQADGQWEILLDNRVIKTPGRRPLRFDQKSLAELVAAEWDFQSKKTGIEPATMPLMSLCATAVDQISLEPLWTVNNLLQYLRTDTICFFFPEHDRILLKRQIEEWESLHSWAEGLFGQKLGRSSDAITIPSHPIEVINGATKILTSMEPFTLAAMQSLTIECKSMVIALAVVFRKLNVEQAFVAARVEESFNIENWGLVEGGHDQDICSTRLHLSAASTLLSLTNGFLRN